MYYVSPLALPVAAVSYTHLGIIKNVGGFGALRRRLLEMGLTPGTRIMVQKMAPSGDPIEIHIRGYQLTLRRDDARQIELMEEGA